MGHTVERISLIGKHIDLGIERTFTSRIRRKVEPQGIIHQLQEQLRKQELLESTASTYTRHRKRFDKNFPPLHTSSFVMCPPERRDIFVAMKGTGTEGLVVRTSFFNPDSSITKAQAARITLQRMNLGQQSLSGLGKQIFERVLTREGKYEQAKKDLMHLMSAEKHVLLEGLSSKKDGLFAEVKRTAIKAKISHRMLQLQLLAFQLEARNMQVGVRVQERNAVGNVAREIAKQKHYLFSMRRPEIIVKKRKGVLSSDAVKQAERELRLHHNVSPVSLQEFKYFLGVKINNNAEYTLQPCSRLGALLLYQDLERAAGESFEQNLAIPNKAEAAYKALQIRLSVQKKICVLTKQIEEFIARESISGGSSALLSA